MKYERLFYVCFCKTDTPRWWHIFTGNKRQHIFLITSCTNTSCVMIETSEGGCGVYGFPEPAEAIAKNVESNGVEVVKFLVEEYNMTRPRIKLLRSCVGHTKDFLGIDNPFIQTPNQLYNLIKGVNHE